MDPIQLLIEALAASGVVPALVGANVYGGQLPEHFDPTSNPALVIHVRGGQSHSEIPIATVSVGLTAWAGVNQFKRAREVYQAVVTALNGLSGSFPSGRIITCYEEVFGQDITDPITGWATVLSYYNVTISAS